MRSLNSTVAADLDRSGHFGLICFTVVLTIKIVNEPDIYKLKEHVITVENHFVTKIPRQC